MFIPVRALIREAYRTVRFSIIETADMSAFAAA
jgi:hypothetical protein